MEEYLDWTSIHDLNTIIFIINGIGIKLYTVINDQHTHMFYYILLFKKLDQIKTHFNYNVLKNVLNNVYMIVDLLF